MFDLRAIRTDATPFDAAWKKRGLEPQSPEILRIDTELRAVQTALQERSARRNEVSKSIGLIKRDGGDASAAMAEVAELKELMPALEDQERDLSTKLNDLLSSLPNLPMDDVPAGSDEEDNQLLRTWGEPRKFDFEPRQHFELGEALGQMDFEAAAKLSGSRFVVLKKDLAKLERSLTQYMLDVQTEEFGRTEMQVPYLVRDKAMYGTSQLPKFEEDLFKTTDDRYLIPTSEVPLTNLVADEIVPAEDLPYRFTAWTPCFRSEAGSAGRDTRGLIRQHQFHKVEMVSIVEADKSEEELEIMTNCAEELLKRLELPYRVMLLCSGDMGFGARKTYDLEVWLPGQDQYREISSCSNCWDFQARRMNARSRTKGDKGTSFVHTLNGSGLAVGRTLVALLENHQQADGSISIPEVLRPYMGGRTTIPASNGA